jgi:sensor histidine kinase YesM
VLHTPKPFRIRRLSVTDEHTSSDLVSDQPARSFGLIGALQLSSRSLILITTLFWLYVTLSDVLYAYSMQVDVSKIGDVEVFAPWQQRVLQHVLLFPLLLACYWASLRVGWSRWWIAVQVSFGVAFAALTFWVMVLAILIFKALTNAPTNPADEQESFASLWVASFISFLISYGFGLALVTGVALYQRFHDSQLRVASLEREWSSARLAALRMQLSPHTLFNLLHTIRGQIEWEPQVAQSMMVQLADLLRRLLNAGERDFSLLGEELRFVQLYLQLQQRRFADRLSAVLPDVEAQAAIWVPSLILQPLVENAVVHGLAGHEAPIVVRVEVLLSIDSLILRVINTIGPSRVLRNDGIGLRNVRERLAVQFGTQAELNAGPTDDDTWVAQLTIPVLRELNVAPQSQQQLAR